MDSFRLNEKDKRLLNQYMEKNNLKNRTEALRECLRKAVASQEIENFIFDINNKLNRLVYNQTMTKKLLEQFFVNMGFQKNIDVKESEILEEFKEKNNKYGNNFLG